jgi:quercetin dioxygenase-like cupin family protein
MATRKQKSKAKPSNKKSTPKKSTYSRSNRLSGKKLEFLLKAEEDALRERAASSSSGRAAKTLAKEGRLRVMIIALNRATVLKQHHTDGPVSIQCLRGNVAITIDDASTELTSGGLLILDAKVQHQVKAIRDSSLLITMSFPRDK